VSDYWRSQKSQNKCGTMYRLDTSRLLMWCTSLSWVGLSLRFWTGHHRNLPTGFLICTPMMEEWTTEKGIDVLDGWTFQASEIHHHH
jgi:hypothetical protein